MRSRFGLVICAERSVWVTSELKLTSNEAVIKLGGPLWDVDSFDCLLRIFFAVAGRFLLSG